MPIFVSRLVCEDMRGLIALIVTVCVGGGGLPRQNIRLIRATYVCVTGVGP